MCGLPNLRSLDLRGNRLGEKIVVKVLKAATSLASLTKLDLSSNVLKLKGAKQLSKLIDNINLITLQLSECKISDEAASKILPAVKRHVHITELDLSSNEIGEGAALILGEIIASSSLPLTSLNLMWNCITGKGAQSIGDAMRFNTSLLNINCAFNQFNDIGACAIGQGFVFYRVPCKNSQICNKNL
jgi:Ran GTPase-activating protein (RanGAP) involved in mRNA processing and transport